MAVAAQRSLIRRVTYNLTRLVVRLLCVVLFRIRCGNRQLVPAEGGALVCPTIRAIWTLSLSASPATGG